MKITRIYAIFLRQLYLLRHNATRLANIFIWIVLDITLWGFITKYLNSVGHSGFSFIPLLLGAVILWDFLIRIQQGVMLAFFEDVWSRNFLNLFASPLTIGEYAAGLVITGFFTSMLGLILMFVLSWLFFAFNIFSFGVALVPFLLIIYLFGLSIGIFAAGVVLRYGPSAEWLAWPIPFLFSPFAGVFYPISILPHPMQMIAKIIPPSYVFEGMRGILSGSVFSLPAFTAGISLSIFYLALAYLFFTAIYRKVIKNGLIARFSAENL